jgi:hypothetical protein
MLRHRRPSKLRWRRAAGAEKAVPSPKIDHPVEAFAATMTPNSRSISRGRRQC